MCDIRRVTVPRAKYGTPTQARRIMQQTVIIVVGGGLEGRLI